MNTNDFKKRFMPNMNGQQMLPQGVFRNFLYWLQEQEDQSDARTDEQMDSIDEFFNSITGRIDENEEGVSVNRSAISRIADVLDYLLAQTVSLQNQIDGLIRVEDDTLYVTYEGKEYQCTVSEVVPEVEEPVVEEPEKVLCVYGSRNWNIPDVRYPVYRAEEEDMELNGTQYYGWKTAHRVEIGYDSEMVLYSTSESPTVNSRLLTKSGDNMNAWNANSIEAIVDRPAVPEITVVSTSDDGSEVVVDMTTTGGAGLYMTTGFGDEPANPTLADNQPSGNGLVLGNQTNEETTVYVKAMAAKAMSGFNRVVRSAVVTKSYTLQPAGV